MKNNLNFNLLIFFFNQSENHRRRLDNLPPADCQSPRCCFYRMERFTLVTNRFRMLRRPAKRAAFSHLLHDEASVALNTPSSSVPADLYLDPRAGENARCLKHTNHWFLFFPQNNDCEDIFAFCHCSGASVTVRPSCGETPEEQPSIIGWVHRVQSRYNGPRYGTFVSGLQRTFVVISPQCVYRRPSANTKSLTAFVLRLLYCFPPTPSNAWASADIFLAEG